VGAQKTSKTRDGSGLPVSGLVSSAANEFWPHAKSMKVSVGCSSGCTRCAIAWSTRAEVKWREKDVYLARFLAIALSSTLSFER
jgi:tRNA A37 methylthiotransferase MiaB